MMRHDENNMKDDDDDIVLLFIYLGNRLFYHLWQLLRLRRPVHLGADGHARGLGKVVPDVGEPLLLEHLPMA